MSSALAGGFLTTGPPGKSQAEIINRPQCKFLKPKINSKWGIPKISPRVKPSANRTVTVCCEDKWKGLESSLEARPSLGDRGWWGTRGALLTLEGWGVTRLFSLPQNLSLMEACLTGDVLAAPNHVTAMSSCLLEILVFCELRQGRLLMMMWETQVAPGWAWQVASWRGAAVGILCAEGECWRQPDSCLVNYA